MSPYISLLAVTEKADAKKVDHEEGLENLVSADPCSEESEVEDLFGDRPGPEREKSNFPPPSLSINLRLYPSYKHKRKKKEDLLSSLPLLMLLEAMPAAKKNLDQLIILAFNKLLKDIGNQVEFELPDSFNKSKSTAYTLIKRNIYLTKKIKRRLEDDGIFCSCSASLGSPRVCDRDCHCGMLLSSCSSGCKCGSSCNNKPFQHRPLKKMKLVQTEKCGSGIVADEDIKQGEFVIEYVGEVIDDNTCEERLWKMKHRGETNFYLCEINRNMVIDATYKGNKSRYINHSCCPNTEMQKWIIDGETRIGIFATRDIKKGEHLTYDYQFVQFGADQDCHCGAAGCRKKLGVKPSKPKMSSDAALKLVACQVAVSSPKLKAMLSGKDVCICGCFMYGSSQNAFSNLPTYSCNCIGEVVRLSSLTDQICFGIIKRYDEYSRKHSIMFEDGTVKFLDMSKEDWEFVT
ncbi:SET DOMAIN PROTEINS, partial [Salix purpurea]